jgi:hypothetical protein
MTGSKWGETRIKGLLPTVAAAFLPAAVSVNDKKNGHGNRQRTQDNQASGALKCFFQRLERRFQIHTKVYGFDITVGALLNIMSRA